MNFLILNSVEQSKEKKYRVHGKGGSLLQKETTTRFLWEGDVILHEWKESGHEEAKITITWLFDEGSFTPGTKITKEEAYSVISDYLGTPFAMYDTHGKKVWENELDIYGRVIAREGDVGHCYFRFWGSMRMGNGIVL